MLLSRAPEVDRAWSIVVVGFLVTLVSQGFRFAIGPFFAPLMQDFAISRTYLSMIVAIGALVYGIGMVVAGRLADRWGARMVAAVGGVVLAISLFLTAKTHSPMLFGLGFALFTSFGFGATSQTVLSTIISRWFDRKRGLAMTFLSAGAMGGIAVGTPLSAALISWIGWRGTYNALALVFLVALVPIVWIGLPGNRSDDLAARPRQPGPGQAAPVENWRAALRTAPFWYMAVSFFACGWSMNLLGAHGVPMLEHSGFPTMTAAYGVGLIGVVSFFGSLVLGAASDRYGRRPMLALIYGVRGLGFLGLLTVARDWELFAVTFVGGMVWAGNAALTSAATADIYGARWVGTLFGWMYLGHQVGGTIAAYLGGWGFETFGNYHLSFSIGALLLFMAAYLSVRLPRGQEELRAVRTGLGA